MTFSHFSPNDKMRSTITFTIAFATIVLSAASVATAQDKKIMTAKDSASYAVGASVGRSIKDQDLDVDAELVASGMRDALAGTLKLTPEQLQVALMAMQQQAMEKMQARQAVAGTENAAKGEKFLAENKNKPGITVTASGLQYKVNTEGTGKKPTKDNVVKVHYTGKLLDGTVFDSSVERGEPAEFPLSGVIAGWTEALQLMSVGSKYTIYLPPSIAYGERGAGGQIGPNATLIFDVELIEIVK
jgi:FKBP-type peptidyl-prolyl cis-trans isomerase